MLQIEMADVLALLGVVAPYLVVVGLVLLVWLVAVVAVRKRPRAQRTLVRGGSALGALVAVVVVANLVAFGPMATLINLSTGGGQVTEQTNAKAREIAEKVSAEGFVLLENEEDLLPLEDSKVNLFGWAAANPVYGGSGSGSINNLYETVSIADGLENAGLDVNRDLLDFYGEYTSERPEMSIQKQSWTLPEPPVDTYNDDLLQGAKEFSDVAVVVVSRMAGEGHTDLPTNVSEVGYDDNSTQYEDFPAGEHYLQLSQTEADLIDLVTTNFTDVVLVYNSANPMELGFTEEYEQIKSVLWAPGPGNQGFASLGKILTGEVNPSGRAADSFIYDMTASPWWNNQVKRPYDNMSDLTVEGMNAGQPESFQPSFINYVDSIYVGYKFYETAADEGLLDFEKTVQFPFGHGLSYTTFSQEMSAIEESDGSLSFTVTVTNTGAVRGKDVVQVYSNPPYTDGGIEKSTANLMTFAKTADLEPGASETVALSIAVEELASFDVDGSGAYILEAGNYVISANSNSHEVLDEQTYTVSNAIDYQNESRPSDDIAATGLFQEAAGDFPVLSRAGGFANYATAVASPTSTVLPEPYASEYHLNSNFDYSTYLDPEAEMPTTGADNGMLLEEMRGAEFDDPRWETLLDQLSVDDMALLTSLAGYQTPAIDSVGKVQAVDSDGPAAINNNFTGAGSIGFPVAVVIASTWNPELAREYGEAMGKMAREMGSAGWYAPGMNTHRSPFGARNYEYFSEDGLLAGRIAAQAVSGANDEGVYAFIKHFALYDSNGKMVSIWADEQAIREIYLKPFELSVKEGGANAVMVSWNFIGSKWAGEWSELMETVLRDEWGFEGFVLTDFFRNNGHGFMTADAALANGVDGMLSTFEGGPNNVKDRSDPSTVLELRRASKNIMFPVVNSWLYSEEQGRPQTPGWQIGAIVADGILGLLVIGGGVLVLRRSRKFADADATAQG